MKIISLFRKVKRRWDDLCREELIHRLERESLQALWRGDNQLAGELCRQQIKQIRLRSPEQQARMKRALLRVRGHA